MENQIVRKSSRAFNEVIIDKTRGIVYKKSKDFDKLRAEAFWYKNLPAEVGAFAPKLLWVDDPESEIVIEYCPYVTLSELFTSLSAVNWKHILTRLLQVHRLFRQQAAPRDLSLLEFHIDKTKTRVLALKSEEPFRSLLQQHTIIINNKWCKNINIDKVLKDLSELSYHSIPALVHGDYCLSNILYDLNSDCVKLIDPRGYFLHKGTPELYGDAQYDFAKLMHSVHGLYDFIVQGKYVLYSTAPNTYYFQIVQPQRMHELVHILFSDAGSAQEHKYRCLLEILLFVTMIPLHYDDSKRQLAFYLRAVQLYNELYLD